MPTPASTAALGILLILLPGFACSFMVQQLTVKAKQTEFDKLVEALLFSFILYLGTLPFFGSSLPLAWTESKQQGFTSYTIHLHWSQLFALGLGATVLALLYAVNSKYDLLHRMLRKLRLTERTSRVSVWNDAFQDIQSR